MANKRLSLLFQVVTVACLAVYMVQYRFDLIPMSDPLSFEQLVMDKFRLPWLLLEKLEFAQAYLR